jgi:hypothetical protein
MVYRNVEHGIRLNKADNSKTTNGDVLFVIFNQRLQDQHFVLLEPPPASFAYAKPLNGPQREED